MSSKNVINVTKTISERHQLRSVSVFYHGMFNFHLYELPELVQTKREITDDNNFIKNMEPLPDYNQIFRKKRFSSLIKKLFPMGVDENILPLKNDYS